MDRLRQYLLELTRYIHLNPLRARLVEDLKTLDKYPWSGHSALIGKQKNPLVPEIPPAIKEDEYLAEKTVEDVLQYFGKSLKEARRRYRQFVEKGIKQACPPSLSLRRGGRGRREDLQGGGLIRSSGGDKAVLLGLKREERDLPDSPEASDGGRGKGDARILGSGDFVSTTLEQSERGEKKYLPKRPIEELIEIVAGKLGLKPELICSGNRQRQYSEARSLVAWLAVEEIGHPAAEVARFLGITRVGVLLSLEKAKDICQKYEFELTPPNLTDSIC